MDVILLKTMWDDRRLIFRNQHWLPGSFQDLKLSAAKWAPSLVTLLVPSWVWAILVPYL